MNANAVRVREPPRAAASSIVRRFPRASAGTTNEQRAIGLVQAQRTFLNRLPPIQTLL